MLSLDTLVRLRGLLAAQTISAGEPNLVEVAGVIAAGLAELDAEIAAAQTLASETPELEGVTGPDDPGR